MAQGDAMTVIKPTKEQSDDAIKILEKWKEHLRSEHQLSIECEVMKELVWSIGEAIDRKGNTENTQKSKKIKTKNYLKFELIERKQKTAVYLVRSTFNGEAVGKVSWHWAWRHYGFYPISDTVFDSSCLSEIKDFVDSLMNKRRGTE